MKERQGVPQGAPLTPALLLMDKLSDWLMTVSLNYSVLQRKESKKLALELVKRSSLQKLFCLAKRRKQKIGFGISEKK